MSEMRTLRQQHGHDMWFLGKISPFEGRSSFQHFWSSTLFDGTPLLNRRKNRAGGIFPEHPNCDFLSPKAG
jgi:hypothetical protein